MTFKTLTFTPSVPKWLSLMTLCNQQTQFQLSFSHQNELHTLNINTESGGKILWKLTQQHRHCIILELSNSVESFQKCQDLHVSGRSLSRIMVFWGQPYGAKNNKLGHCWSCEGVLRGFGCLGFFNYYFVILTTFYRRFCWFAWVTSILGHRKYLRMHLRTLSYVRFFNVATFSILFPLSLLLIH